MDPATTEQSTALPPQSRGKATCLICGQAFRPYQRVDLQWLDSSLVVFLKTQVKVPDEVPNEPPPCLCFSDLKRLRTQYITQLLIEEKGVLNELQQRVINSLKDSQTLTQNIHANYEKSLTLGQRLADLIATFGGSWKFIITFFLILFSWIVFNSISILQKPFDPYPYILLNLCLSCLASIQAPIIMMSQNRQEARDRLRSEQDYEVNLKAELEIQHINLKLDTLMNQQWAHLMEFQRLQLDMLEEQLRPPKGSQPLAQTPQPSSPDSASENDGLTSRVTP